MWPWESSSMVGHPPARTLAWEVGARERPGGRPSAPRHQDVPDALVLLEVPDALPVHPQHLLPLRVAQGGRGVVVARALDDQLGGAARGDTVVEAQPLAYQLLLDPEVRIGLRNHPHRPAGAVRREALLAIGEDLVRRVRFVTGAEWAHRGGGALRARPDEHPAAPRRILPEIAHDSATIGNAPR